MEFWPTIPLLLLCFQIKIYFLRNAMMIFSSLVKIITTHTHTYAITDIKKKILSICRDFGRSLRLIHPGTTSNLSHGGCIIMHTHTKYHIYVHIQ